VLRRYTNWTIVIATSLSMSLSGCSLKCWNKYDCPDPPAYDECLISEYADRGLKIEDPAPNVCEDEDYLEIPDSPSSINPDNIDLEAGYWDLSLEEAVRIALQNSQVMRDLGGIVRSPDSITTMYDPAIAYTDGRFGEEAALSAFDATFSASAYFDRNNRRVNNSTVGEVGFFDQDLHNYEATLEKRNATGGLMTLRSVTQYDFNNNQQRIFEAGWDTYIDAELRQPLLQGAGVQFNRIAGPNAEPGFANGVLVARTRTDISLAEFEIAVRDLVSDVENAYWDLYYSYRDLDAKIEARNRVLEVWQKAYANVEQGRKSADNEAQAREQYFRFESEVVNALHGRLVQRTQNDNGQLGGTFNNPGGVRVAERRLRFMLGLPQTNGRLIRPSTDAPVARVNFDWDLIAVEALARRPELRRQKWVIKQRELELLANRNFLKPNLDLVARYRPRGFGQNFWEENNTGDPANNSAVESLINGDYHEAQLGIEFDMPIGFRRAHAAVRSSQLSLARAKAILREEEKQVMFGLSNTYGDITRSYEIMELLFNRREAANMQEATVRASYEAGKAPIDLLLEAQRRVIDSSILFNQARVDYALAIKNLHFEKGSLLEFYNVMLAEGPWPQKAYNDALMRDLLKRRAHTDYVINEAVIGQPVEMTDTLKPSDTYSPVDGEVIEIHEMPTEASAAFSPMSNPLRAGSSGPVEIEAEVVQALAPVVSQSKPVGQLQSATEPVAAPVIKADPKTEGVSFGDSSGANPIWLH